MKINRLLLASLLYMIVVSYLSTPAWSQVVWQETFTYPDGTVTGANNNTANPAADWTSSCATCLAGDYFEVRAGKLESNDSNGPARITTETINISSFPSGVELSIDFSEVGTMEGCPSGVSSGCNSIDFIRVEVSLNGGSFQDLSHANGGPCAGACTDGDGTFVAIDDFGSFTFRQCPLVGNSLRIRISVQEWAADEFHRIDNIIITPQACLLPVELVDFQVTGNDAGAVMDWQITENSGQGHFLVEKSQDGELFQSIGRVEMQEAFPGNTFSFLDKGDRFQDAYYRINMVDSEGNGTFSSVELLHAASPESRINIYPNPSSGRVTLSALPSTSSLDVFDLQGKVVFSLSEVNDGQTIDISPLPAGYYFVRLTGTVSTEMLRILINQP